MTIEGAPGPAEAQALRRAALAALETGADVTVDCGAAEHLHAAVLQVVLALERELGGRGRRLRLTNVPAAVEQFLVTAGVQRLIRGEASR